MTSEEPSRPDWDLEQLEVILEDPDSWQLVIAGPGAGKSAVACQRVAYLVDAGVSPSRILLVSFTRTAVTELRDRIVSYAAAGERARSVRISTIDSHAWSLRIGFDDKPLPRVLGDGSYDLSIQRTVELFRDQNPDLIDFMERLEHLIIDEAQDVMARRADLVLEMLKRLSPECGVTILADPAQAIYGFTLDSTDDSELEPSLLERLPAECPRPLLERKLKNIHRVDDNALVKLFTRTREAIEAPESASGHLARVKRTIQETCSKDFGVKSFKSLAEYLRESSDSSTLALFRRRADVLVASSYCSEMGVEHRLRMSDVPIVVRPWVGWLLGETVQSFLGREDFDRLWESRASLIAAPFVGEERDSCWALLYRLAAGARPRMLDLVHLRNIIARARPPIELCYQELGSSGPILGTIHASKGREADTVVLVIPPHDSGRDGVLDGTESAAILEEGRVYYVGATRARKMLVTASGSVAGVKYLSSNRIYRQFAGNKAQLEVGRDGDVDNLAHLAWFRHLDVQKILAARVGRTTPVLARAVVNENYALRIELEQKDSHGVTHAMAVGQLSASFRADVRELWSRVDSSGVLKPSETIRHLYLMSAATVGLTDAQRNAVMAPFNQSAMALAPVIKGFPMVQFLFRSRRTRRQ